MCFSKNILIGDRIDLLYSNLENKLIKNIHWAIAYCIQV